MADVAGAAAGSAAPPPALNTHKIDAADLVRALERGGCTHSAWV